MSLAVEKTNSLLRTSLPLDALYVNDLNPNQMTDQEFNLLCDNFERVGFVDPIMVRPMEDGRYRIIGGAHRFEVAKILDFKDVPCTVITDPDFDDDQEKFQIVRMNVIKGKMTPDKFMTLYSTLTDKYSEEVLKDSFGFASETEFRKMVKAIEADLPPEMKTTFKEAAKGAKNLNDLATILNKLIATHGDSLPYGYMLIDFGNQDSVWLRMSQDTRKAVMAIGDTCRVKGRTMDDLIGGLIRMAATGSLDSAMEQLIAKSDPVSIPSAMVGLPTADFLASLAKTQEALK